MRDDTWVCHIVHSANIVFHHSDHGRHQCREYSHRVRHGADFGIPQDFGDKIAGMEIAGDWHTDAPMEYIGIEIHELAGESFDDAVTAAEVVG